MLQMRNDTQTKELNHSVNKTTIS